MGGPFVASSGCKSISHQVTFFFSTAGLEKYTREDFIRMVQEENLQTFRSVSDDQRFLHAQKIVDYSGNEMWSINVIVGDEDEQYTDGGQVFNPYLKSDRSV
jgi:hypothetical protein